MISKFFNYFKKRENKNRNIKPEIIAKGHKKLSKKMRKKQALKDRSNAALRDALLDEEIDNYFKRTESSTLKPKYKIRFGKKMSVLIGSALILTACSNTGGVTYKETKQESIKTTITDTKAFNNNSSDIKNEEESVLNHPISVGDAVTLHENSEYYIDACKNGSGEIVYNNYVDENDYNVISAVALVDANGNILSVNYENGFEIFNMVDKALELGIINYEIMLHYGPLNEEQKYDDVNNYQLGWSSILSMDKVKQKTMTK